MKKIFAICLLLTGCFTDAGEARHALDNQGFTDIKIGSTNWFACGKGDKEGVDFTATNSNGKKVAGTVCCGIWFKGCTIRW